MEKLGVNKKVLGMTVLLYGFWLLVSWSFEWMNLLLGLLFSVFVAFFMAPDLISAEESPPFLRRFPYFLKFVGILLYEVIKANFQVVRVVLSPQMPIFPQFNRVPQELKKPVTQAIWGNSITLTPGTLTVDLDEKDILIHILCPDLAGDICQSPVLKVLKKLEGDG